MSAIARICERWTVSLPGPAPWTGEDLTATWLACASLLSVYGPEDIVTVYEPFPSPHYVQAMMVQELFRPEWHLIAAMTDKQPDLYLLDFPSFSAWDTKAGMPHRNFLDQVFARDPKAVVLSDTAGRQLASRQQRYEGVLGLNTCHTYGRYLLALLDRLEAMYGYVLCRGYWGTDRAVLALVPNALHESVPCQLQATPANPIGLELF